MEPTQAYRSALEKRTELQNSARKIGIDENYISLLVDSFYEKVRSEPELGPIFDRIIEDRWPKHLARMKEFWASVALRSGIYLGKPVEAHQALTGVQRQHFDIWMRLFEQTLRETAPNEEVVRQFLKLAQAIGARLQQVMFE